MQDQNDKPGQRRSRLRRGVTWGLLAAGALPVLLAARPIAAAVGGGACHHMRWGHGANPEAIHEHVQVALKWALRDIGASDEQTSRVQAIATQALGDLAPLRGQHQANREAFHALLVKPTLDRDALEGLRKAELGLADTASRRLVQALAEVADVLTPEQRQALVERHSQQH